MKLHWGDQDDMQTVRGIAGKAGFDVVLAADVVYGQCRHVMDALFDTISECMSVKCCKSVLVWPAARRFRTHVYRQNRDDIDPLFGSVCHLM